MDYSKYTPRQEAIIKGDLPISKISEFELDRINAKAIYYQDKGVVFLINKELCLRGRQINPLSAPYSEKMRELLKGKLSIEEISNGTLKKGYTQAKQICDEEVMRTLEPEVKRRGIWNNDISGYSTKNTEFITEITPLEEAPDRTLFSFEISALLLCDSDVVDWISEERQRRGVINYAEPKYTMTLDQVERNSEMFLSKATDKELGQLAFCACRSGRSDLLELIENETERKVLQLYDMYYTESEKELISGEKTPDRFNWYALKCILEKAQFDDKMISKTALKKLKQTYECLEDKLEEEKKLKEAYTKTQNAIILGAIPLYKVNSKQLQCMVKKAEFHGHEEIAALLKAELEARKAICDSDSPYTDMQQMIIRSAKEHVRKKGKDETNPVSCKKSGKDATGCKKQTIRETSYITLKQTVYGLRDDEYIQELEDADMQRPYSSRQMQIINGIVPMRAARKSELARLLNKAKMLKDRKVVDKINAFLRIEPADVDYNAVVAEYPDEDIKIARGEIPFEEVTVNQLHALYRRARDNGDTELANLAETLLHDKSLEDKAGNRKKADPNRVNTRKKDEEWAMGILESRIDPHTCTIMDLQDIRLFASKLKDPAYLEVAKFLINIRHEPKSIYKAQTKEEVRELLQMNSLLPIRWPEEWFAN